MTEPACETIVWIVAAQKLSVPLSSRTSLDWWPAGDQTGCAGADLVVGGV